jgi:very-short-patch-repair endonuclease
MIDQTVLDALFRVSESRHGLALLESALELGLTRLQVRTLAQVGRIELVTARVLRSPGSPRTDRQRVLAAVLDAAPDGCASGSTAAALWGVAGYRLFPVHVARPRGATGRRTSLAILHELRALPPHHIRLYDGIPVLGPERTVVDLCRTEHPARAGRTLDDLWRRRLLSGRSVRALVDELSIQGRGGLRVVRELLDQRGDDYVPPASNLEARFGKVIADAGLPAMRRQVDSGDDRWVGRVDFRADAVPLIVEVQSETYHSSLTDQEDDEARLAALRAAGFVVAEVTDWQVWHRPSEVIDAVRSALRELSPAGVG